MSKEKIANELHSPARRNFLRRKIISKGINDLLQADLIEMIPYSRVNRNHKYILIAINFYSKMAYAKPLKDKSGISVTKAMSALLKELPTPPKNLQTDNGKEFYNAHFKRLMAKHKINHYSTYSSMKAAAVERLIRTIKGMLYKRFLIQGSHRWLDILPSVIAKYNNTVHSTIKMKPNEVKTNDLLLSVYRYDAPKREKRASKIFKVGDHVRISRHKTMMEKGYTPNWSAEVFTVDRVQQTSPVTYLLRDLQDKPILGSFYGHEIKRTNFPDTYLIESVIKRRGDRMLVKWYGFPGHFWINVKDVDDK